MMKLYIWEGQGVLQDYTSGMIVAVADSFEDAIKAISEKCDYCGNSYPHLPTRVIDLSDAKPEAWLCWGGG